MTIQLKSNAAQEPKVMLQISNDGGYTFGSELWETHGRAGERFSRVHWHKLGYSRDRVFRITVTDPVKWVIIGATLRIEPEVGK
jgi:hypothetical protein